MDAGIAPLVTGDSLIELRAALAQYTVDSVHGLLGTQGRAAHQRGDLAGVARAIRGADDRRLADLIRLFLLGRTVDESAARAALAPLSLDIAAAAGLVECSAGEARAALEIRPYAEADADHPGPGAPVPPAWWVFSDHGSDVRGGPLASDHVLGIGAASLTLAQATPRARVSRALDIGTGCGVQALHLGRHADHVTATDVSSRALRLAATTSALSDEHWDLRAGSLLEPVRGELFDLVVANPPFVVSAGTGGYDYRDGGLAGDGVCEALLSGLPAVLAPGGTAVLLANWIVPDAGSWRERVGGWLAGRSCDAWVWQREVADPGEYVTLWLRDAGEVPGSARWSERYDAWLDWFAREGVAAVGMGLVALWPSPSAPDGQIVVLEDIPQAVEQPVGAHLPDWIVRQRLLAGTSDDALLRLRPAAAPGLVRTRDDVLSDVGWTTGAQRLRQARGMRWEVELDDAVSALVAGCDGRTPLQILINVLAASLGRESGVLTGAVVPVVRDLMARGFLLIDPAVGSAANAGAA